MKDEGESDFLIILFSDRIAVKYTLWRRYNFTDMTEHFVLLLNNTQQMDEGVNKAKVTHYYSLF